jgi:hypothetical protein
MPRVARPTLQETLARDRDMDILEVFELGAGDRIVPSSMDGIVAFGLLAAAIAAIGVTVLTAIAVVAGVVRRWRR